MATTDLQLEVLGSLPKPLQPTDLQEALQAVVQTLQPAAKGKINCIFVSAKASQALNRQFADHDYPTDVLSFNYFEGKSMNHSADTTLAEIAICSTIAQAQAKEHGNTYDDEIVLLLVHGLMHIFGHDHGKPSERTSFETVQSAIMKKLNRKDRDFKWSV